MSIPAEKRRLCADNALKCHGTAYIFERRARHIRIWLRIISFLGIATPAALGAVLGLVGIKSPHAETASWVAGIIALFQLVASIWSLVSNWDNSLSYSIESKADNYRLSDEFSKLGNSTTLSLQEFDLEMKLLDTQADMRSQLDNRIDVIDAEKRTGLRAGLRKFQRACVGCNKVPTSLKASKCDICGNF